MAADENETNETDKSETLLQHFCMYCRVICHVAPLAIQIVDS